MFSHNKQDERQFRLFFLIEIVCSLLIVFNLVSTSKYLKSWAVVVVSVVVSVLACYSDDPSSNPAEVLRFSVPYLTLVENNQIQAIIL